VIFFPPSLGFAREKTSDGYVSKDDNNDDNDDVDDSVDDDAVRGTWDLVISQSLHVPVVEYIFLRTFNRYIRFFAIA